MIVLLTVADEAKKLLKLLKQVDDKCSFKHKNSEFYVIESLKSKNGEVILQVDDEFTRIKYYLRPSDTAQTKCSDDFKLEIYNDFKLNNPVISYTSAITQLQELITIQSEPEIDELLAQFQ